MAPGLIGQESRSRVMREYWAQGGNATQAYKTRLAELVRPGIRILHAGCGWDKKDVSRRFRDLARRAGLEVVSAELATNGPTWFERFPIVFGLFDVLHRGMTRWDALRQLRCALIVDLRSPEHAPA